MRKSSLVSVILLVACGQSTSDDVRSSVQQCDLEQDDDLCDGMPFGTATASASEATAMAIGGGITWMLDGPGPGKIGYVVFTPKTSGTHTLYFGDEEARQVCDEEALCASAVVGCGALKRAEQYAFIEGLPYVIELNPIASGHPFILHIDEPDVIDPPPPPSGLKLAPKTFYVSMGTFSLDMSVGDLNGDGAVDVALSNPDDAGGELFVDIMANNGSGAFAPVTRVPTSAPRGTVIFDFDSDGDNDIAGIASDGQGPLPNFLLSNTGNFMFTKTTWTPALQYNGKLSSGDFDEDGIVDLVATFVPGEETTTSGFVIIKMPGASTLQEQVEFGASTSMAIAGDFNGDGNQDVLVGSRAAPVVRLWLGNGTGTVAFDREIALPVNMRVTKLVPFDLDTNGFTDFIAFGADDEGFGDEGASVTLSSSSGFATQYLGSSPAKGVAAGDFDRDGRTDLIFGAANASADAWLRWWRGTADGFVPVGPIAENSVSTCCMAAIDVNNDGLLDLVTKSSDAFNTGLDVYLGTP